jgi:hypothetical protein
MNLIAEEICKNNVIRLNTLKKLQMNKINMINLEISNLKQTHY